MQAHITHSVLPVADAGLGQAWPAEQQHLLGPFVTSCHLYVPTMQSCSSKPCNAGKDPGHQHRPRIDRHCGSTAHLQYCYVCRRVDVRMHRTSTYG